MKTVLAVIMLVALATTAQAQGIGGGRHKGGNNADQQGAAEKQKKMAAEEKAAKAAMDKVPDSKEKYDPWKIGK